jgi:hypothetical protein
MIQRVFLNPSDPTLTGKYDNAADEVVIVCDSTIAAFSVRLPDLTMQQNRTFTFYNIYTSGSGNDVTIQPVTGQIIMMNDTSYTLSAGSSKQFQTDSKKRWLY